jgi:ATP-dependent DNA helicase RecG
LPTPKYAFDGLYLNFTIYRHSKAAVSALDRKTLDKLSGDERSSWEFLAKRISTTSKEFADAMNFNARKAQRHLTRFVELGLLKRVGKGPATKYKPR